MSTVETAKTIRKELAEIYPDIKFVVRKVHTGVIHVYHDVTDLDWRVSFDQYLQKFVGWNEFQTEFVFEGVNA